MVLNQFCSFAPPHIFLDDAESPAGWKQCLARVLPLLPPLRSTTGPIMSEAQLSKVSSGRDKGEMDELKVGKENLPTVLCPPCSRVLPACPLILAGRLSLLRIPVHALL